jgi:outer membrane lipoprotein SlyB
MRRAIAIAVSALALSACATVPASRYEPIIDTQGVDPARYAVDLGECQQFAQKIDAERQAVGGAVAGAAVAGLFGALLGVRGNDLARLTAAGAAAGGIRQGAYAGQSQMQIISSCMAGRGYRVLL